LTYRRIVDGAIVVIGVAMALYHMYAIAVAPPEALVFRGVHLLFALVLVFLCFPLAKNRATAGPGDLLLLAVGASIVLYIFINYNYLVNRTFYVDDPLPSDTVMAVLAVLIVLEATRRVIGLALPLTAGVFLAYALLFTDVGFSRLVDQMYLTTEGIFGSTLGVSASYVMIFVLFGSFMERTGTGQLFMDFALSLTGHTAGGPGKVSVVSSSLFGTISGSAVANVMVDGPITIPLMKRTGFPAHFAAGVEAVASTGGQLMPPVMGAAAFVMAEFLQVSYFQVTIWAIIPSMLYYLACFSAVHFEAKRRGLLGVPRSECPKMKDVLSARGHLFIPIVVVLIGMFNDYSAPLAALVATLLCFPVAMLRQSTRKDLRWRMAIDALVDGSKNTLAVAMACASAGIVIGVIALTGLGIVFTQYLLVLAQNSLILALVVTAVAGIVLGMGMPTTPAYIIMTALLVPAIIKLLASSVGGIDIEIARPVAHMFALYFAVLSAITPPVALAVFAAASLAKSDLWATGWAAMRIGMAGFIAPFMFVYEPALLTIGTWQQVAYAWIPASVGIVCLAAGLHGFLIRKLNWAERAWIIAAALCLVKPGLATDMIGFGMVGAMLVWLTALRRQPVAG